MSETWIRTDELTEATKSLDVLYKFLSCVADDSYYWKWCIIAIHNAMQGFMVCALTGSNGLNVLTKDSANAWIAALENGSAYPKEKLDSFLCLYEKTKGKRMLMFVHSARFIPNNTQTNSIKIVNSLRNDFTHFTPKGWSLQVNSLPEVFLDCMNYLDFLLNKSNNIIDIEQIHTLAARRLITQITEQLMNLKDLYGG